MDKGLANSYTCKGTKCSANIQYFIDKKGRKTAVMADSIFTVDVPKLVFLSIRLEGIFRLDDQNK